MHITIVAAVDLKYGIGYNGHLPWNIKEELSWFRKLTSTPNSAVVMGKNTWVSLPRKPLPNRVNIVVSSTITPEEVYTVDSLEGAIRLCKVLMIEHIWIIGGESIYREAIDKKIAQKVILSRIKGEYKTDVKFPKEVEDKYFLTDIQIMKPNLWTVETWN